MLMLLTALVAGAHPSFEGRPIAPVMGWQGADWLERPTREAEEATAALLQAMELAPGDVVADLGCGTGFHARRIAHEVGRRGVVHCVDLQPEMLKRAEDLAEREGVRLQTHRGRHDRIPLASNSVDQLLMVDVYHELQEPDAMRDELRRVLRPGGVLTVVEFRLHGDSARHIQQVHRMDHAQVTRELAAAGFQLLERSEELPSQHLLRYRAP